jgi:hypothetical protein
MQALHPLSEEQAYALRETRKREKKKGGGGGDREFVIISITSGVTFHSGIITKIKQCLRGLAPRVSHSQILLNHIDRISPKNTPMKFRSPFSKDVSCHPLSLLLSHVADSF